MKSVVICGSRRFKSEIREFTKVLKEKGILVFEPILNEPNKEDEKLSERLSRLKFLGLTHHQFSNIRKADVCFIYNKEGYIGNSTALEIGFAAALDKPIYVLSCDKEPARKVLFEEVIDTPEKLVEKLK